MRPRPLSHRLWAITLIVAVGLGACKPRNSNLRDTDEAVANTDFNGYIVSMEYLKEKALAGGRVIDVVSEEAGFQGIRSTYEQGINQLIFAAQKDGQEHIVRLAKVSKADTLFQLGDRFAIEEAKGLTDLFDSCEFPLPCLTMLGELGTLAQIDAQQVVRATAKGSALVRSVESMDEPAIYKKVILAKIANLHVFSMILAKTFVPNYVDYHGDGTRTIIPSASKVTIDRLFTQATAHYRDFEKVLDGSDAVARQILKESLPGEQVALEDVPENIRVRILSEAAYLHAEMVQVMIAGKASMLHFKRVLAEDPAEFFSSMRFPLGIDGQAAFTALMMFPKWESSLPSRRVWLKAVERGGRSLGTGFIEMAAVARELVGQTDELIRSYFKNDRYLGTMAQLGLADVIINNEQKIVKEFPTFRSAIYQMTRYKRSLAWYSSEAKMLQQLSDDELENPQNRINFGLASRDLDEDYMRIFCTYSIVAERNKTEFLKTQGRSFRELIPPGKCALVNNFSLKEGNWKFADEDCQENYKPIKERNICGESTSLVDLDRRVNKNIEEREIAKIRGPVVKKAIILGAAAASIIATMGATSYLAIGAAATEAATGAATAVTFTSAAARIGVPLVNAMIGSAVFTLTNNAILLATGVKKFNRGLAGSMFKEFVIGVGVMLFLPYAAALGESVSASVGSGLGNGFYKALVEKGVVVGVDTLAFLPIPYVATATTNFVSGNSSQTWRDLARIDFKEHLLESILFSLGIRLNTKAVWNTSRSSLRQEIRVALGRQGA